MVNLNLCSSVSVAHQIYIITMTYVRELFHDLGRWFPEIEYNVRHSTNFVLNPVFRRRLRKYRINSFPSCIKRIDWLCYHWRLRKKRCRDTRNRRHAIYHFHRNVQRRVALQTNAETCATFIYISCFLPLIYNESSFQSLHTPRSVVDGEVHQPDSNMWYFSILTTHFRTLVLTTTWFNRNHEVVPPFSMFSFRSICPFATTILQIDNDKPSRIRDRYHYFDIKRIKF